MSFNVNGIRSRLHQIQAVIDKHQPDILGLQETKVVDDAFPLEAVQDMGYEAIFHGQKGHYGVALLYHGDYNLVETAKGYPHDDEDAQRRLVSATVETKSGPLHIYNGYFPQGESRDHPVKFPAKEAFYRHLAEHLRDKHKPSEQVVVMGDMNVAPFDKDIGIGDDNRKRWLRTGKCCFLPEEREWLETLTHWGLKDTYEQINGEPGEPRYSWFDYRSRGFERDPKRGLRIDLILASAPLVKHLKTAGVDQEIRGMTKPSDHCPVWVDFDRL